MAASSTTSPLKLRLARSLQERLGRASRAEDTSPANLAADLIETGLNRLEAQQRREARLLERLAQRLLSEGQSVQTPDDAPHGHADCALCLCPVLKTESVEGPLLCDDCFILAQGEGNGTHTPR